MKKATDPLDATAMEWVLARLGDEAGIDASALDRPRLEWTVGHRARALDLANSAEYVEHLASSTEEIDQLVDAIVIPETRFFRDAAVFEHLRAALPKLMGAAEGTLRVLSAPCSTGQEAYSIAALLADAGAKYTMDAFDISSAAIATAKKGSYPKASVKQLSVEQRHLLGAVDEDEWSVHATLRRSIHFRRCNLSQTKSLGSAKYHLILCRNLFIYLRPSARAELARSLAEALLPGGRLVLGTADRVEEVNAYFAPVRPAATFAFMHRAESRTLPAISSGKAIALVAAKERALRRPRSAAPKTVVVQTHTEVATDATALYARAMEHEKHGELAKAERRCRQALYLDPKFLPALELLESLWRHHPNVRMRHALAARIDRQRETASSQKEAR